MGKKDWRGYAMMAGIMVVMVVGPVSGGIRVGRAMVVRRKEKSY